MTAIPVRSVDAMYRSWEAVSLPCAGCKSVLRVARMAGIEQPHLPLMSRREFCSRFQGQATNTTRPIHLITKACTHGYRLVRSLPPRPHPQDVRVVRGRFGARTQTHPPLRAVQSVMREQRAAAIPLRQRAMQHDEKA
jgi:hypothetical protein